MATGTATKSSPHSGAAKLIRIRFTCVATAGGVVVSDAFSMSGLLQRVELVPGTGAAPSANWNFQVRRRSSASSAADLLNGAGAGRGDTLTEEVRPEDDNGNAELAPVMYDENLYVCADAVGSGGQFVADLYFLQP